MIHSTLLPQSTANAVLLEQVAHRIVQTVPFDSTQLCQRAEGLQVHLRPATC